MVLTYMEKKRPPKSNKIIVIGGYIEEVNLNKIDSNIDAIVSTHNLEHLNDPYKVLKKFVDTYDEKTTFFIEVPDADLMIKTRLIKCFTNITIILIIIR